MRNESRKESPKTGHSDVGFVLNFWIIMMRKKKEEEESRENSWQSKVIGTRFMSHGAPQQGLALNYRCLRAVILILKKLPRPLKRSTGGGRQAHVRSSQCATSIVFLPPSMYTFLLLIFFFSSLLLLLLLLSWQNSRGYGCSAADDVSGCVHKSPCSSLLFRGAPLWLHWQPAASRPELCGGFGSRDAPEK